VKPYPHQVDAIAEVESKLSQLGCVYVAGEMRTGKTLISLLATKHYNNVLIVTKKNAMSGWNETIEATELSNRTIINYQSIHKIEGTFDCIILDESHTNISSFPQMATTAKKVFAMTKNSDVVFLSGTPSPESFAQLYHQFAMAHSKNPFARYKDFYEWFDTFGIEQSFEINDRVVISYKQTKAVEVLEAIKPFIVTLTQHEADFASEVAIQAVYVDAEPMLYEMMKDLKTDSHIAIADMEIVAKTPLSKMQKIHQLSSGTLKTELLSFDVSTHKVDWISSNCNSYKKVLILTNYIQEVKLLLKYLPNTTDDLNEFQFGSKKYFVGNAKSYCEGTDFSYCDVLVLYSLNFSSAVFQQSVQRLSHKLREDNPTVYVLMTANSIDELVFDSVNSKKDFTSRYYL
jgi:hypothetical protein